jgi:DNA primase
MQKRGFNEEALRAFGVGYAPQTWEGLVQYVQKKSVNLEVMALAGLISRRDGDSARGAGYYDRFRHRVMFPICNLSGSVVAFGGRRIVADEDSPKYMNSPETPIYHKGTILYGLYQGREAIKAADRVIVVEGYLDLMRMHLCGFRNAVATSGTALTEHQARLILRYTKNVTLLFDSDTAGQSATLRGADILVENGLAVSVAIPPGGTGDDPDSFLAKHPVEAMRQILQTAPPLLEFKILNGAGAKAQAADPVSRRTEQLRSIVETASKVSDALQRQALVHNIAERLNIDEAILIEEINRLHRANYPSSKPRQRKTGGQEPAPAKISSEPLRAITAAAAEEYLISMMILYNDAIRFVFNFMRADDFADPNMRAIASVLYELFENGILPGDASYSERAALLHHFNDPRQAEFVSRGLHAGKFPGKNQNLEEETPAFQFEYRRVCADCMTKLLRKRKEEEIQNLQKQLREREKTGKTPRNGSTNYGVSGTA